MGVYLFVLESDIIFKFFFAPAFIVSYQDLVLVILVFTCAMVILLFYTFAYIFFKRRLEKKYDKWKGIANLLIRKAIFLEETEEEGTMIPLTPMAEKLLRNSDFRKLLSREIVSAKKSISGSSGDNLKRLYQQLELDKYSLIKLKSRHWHVIAQGIQELAIMGMKEKKYLSKIYRFTNNSNELLRMEAQAAIVEFYSFRGLPFLDSLEYPISEWQQIKLLQQLSHAPPENFSGIEKWLKSANNSVVIFALKLARNYHRFELHDNIISCLDHQDPQVRFQAIYSLKEIYSDETSQHLIARYDKEDLNHQIAIMKVLEVIGSDQDIPFLTHQLCCDDYGLRLCAVRSLAHIGDGIEILKRYGYINENLNDYPIKQMIAQVNNELTT